MCNAIEEEEDEAVVESQYKIKSMDGHNSTVRFCSGCDVDNDDDGGG